ncbi:MAG: FtsX-like permease family protein [Acidobacteria bacterium]|nr:FtsX-like permease family protein [Acidobacteriota bacterium]
MMPTIPFLEILRTASQALLRNWGRAVLTSLSMVVGTASLVLVVVAGISGRAYTLEQIRGVGSNLITIYHETDDASARSTLADRLNMEDLEAIRREIPGVRSAAPIILSHPTISLEGIARIVSLIGTVPDYRQVRNLDIVRGRFIDENDERSRAKVCVVTQILAQRLERDPFYNGSITLYGIRFKVIGIFREKVNTFGQTEVTDNSAVVPISVVRYFKPADTIDQMYISADQMENVPQISAQIRQLLTARHGNKSLFKVDNLADILKAANKISLGLTLVLLVIAAISLISSGIGIMNVMLITVTERTREIGIKKAIGAFRRVLLIEFLVEALILTCGGGIVGVFLGLAVPYSVHFFAAGIEIQIPPAAIVAGFGVTLLIGVVFGMLPALRASRMNPVEALRYE